MEPHHQSNPRAITIRDLYPHLTEEQLQEAEEHLTRYIELSLRIYERICNDPEAYAHFKALTSEEGTRYDKQQAVKVDPTIGNNASSQQ